MAAQEAAAAIRHGVERYGAGDLEGAAAELERALELVPADPRAQKYLGWVRRCLRLQGAAASSERSAASAASAALSERTPHAERAAEEQPGPAPEMTPFEELEIESVSAVGPPPLEDLEQDLAADLDLERLIAAAEGDPREAPTAAAHSGPPGPARAPQPAPQATPVQPGRDDGSRASDLSLGSMASVPPPPGLVVPSAAAPASEISALELEEPGDLADLIEEAAAVAPAPSPVPVSSGLWSLLSDEPLALEPAAAPEPEPVPQTRGELSMLLSDVPLTEEPAVEAPAAPAPPLPERGLSDLLERTPLASSSASSPTVPSIESDRMQRGRPAARSAREELLADDLELEVLPPPPAKPPRPAPPPRPAGQSPLAEELFADLEMEEEPAPELRPLTAKKAADTPDFVVEFDEGPFLEETAEEPEPQPSGPLSPVLPPPPAGRPATPEQKLLDEADRALRKGDREAAFTLAEQLISLAGGSAEAEPLRPYSAKLADVYEGFLSPMNRIPRAGRFPKDLEPHTAFMLSLLDGSMTMEEALTVSGMDRLRGARTMATLLRRGLLQVG